jgi:hypothetical protein
MPDKMGLANIGPTPVIKVNHWPGLAHGNGKEFSAATFGDLLAEFVFANEDEIHFKLAEWKSVFSDLRPDVLVADYAPGAVLAARGLIPVVNIGEGYYLPPPNLAEFPQPFGLPPVTDEALVAERVSKVLKRLLLPPLTAYPDVGRAAATLVCNFPELDIYDSQRDAPAIGPLGPMPQPIYHDHGPAKLFAYFPKGTEFDARLVHGLRQAGLPGQVVIPQMAYSAQITPFETKPRFVSKLADLSVAFTDAAVFVTHGGAQTVAAALAAGVPQVIVGADDEKRLIAKRLEKAGTAVAINAKGFQSADLGRVIREVASSPALRNSANRLAAKGQALIARHPLGRVIAAIEAQIKGGPA